MLTNDMLKANNCAMDGVSNASKTLEIERKPKVQLDCEHSKNSKYDEQVKNNEGKLMVIKCDKISKEERIKCEKPSTRKRE